MINYPQLLHLPKINAKASNLYTFGSLSGSSNAFVITQLAIEHQGPVLCITADTPSANRIEKEIRYLLGERLNTLLLPDWEILPYDHFSPHQDIISGRLETLYHLPHFDKGVVIVPVATLIQRLPPVAYLLKNSLILKTGQKNSMTTLKQNLATVGYTAVTQVMEHGEFAARGSILDIFPMGCNTPLRVDFFDDEIDSIRTFDPETQRSLDKLEEVNCLPAREFPTDRAGIEQFRQNYRRIFQRTGSAESIYGQISQGQIFNGIESYLPLFFTETASLFEYLHANTLCVRTGDIHQASETFWHALRSRYESRRHDLDRPVLDPDSLFLSPQAMFEGLKNYVQYKVQTDPSSKGINTNIQPLPDLIAAYQKTQPLAKLEHFLQQTTHKVLFSVPSAGRREVLFDLLKHIDLQPQVFTNINHFLTQDAPHGIIVSPIEHGFCLPDAKLVLIAESDLLGQRVVQRALSNRKAEIQAEAAIRNLAELSIGQAVTHIDHGIARYQGLETITSKGVPCEYLKLEYDNASILYVPVTAVHKISRYCGSEHIVLSRLGSDKWQKSKRKAAEKIHDVAAQLLSLYAKREASPGFACHLDNKLYQQFSGEFPFEETPDQALAIEAVLTDMQSAKCMDRLICGDVGFGKTEVAMRAAFVAVQAKKQVALLVPTTLLAQQHYENFRDRFANWPVYIEQLSRFRTSKEAKITLEKLAAGKIDIIIGTHKLLGQEVKFSDLGLLIIDEEHRFGVKQKEAIKSMRAQVDILALTATPIPRTLNLSVHGLRDLSIIATPPAKRLSIKTFIQQHNDLLVSEAIERELKRGGQVYYLHNEVSSIHRCQEKLQTLIPHASIRLAHGQMRERELEQVMSDFYHQRFSVLVCTTIIETGIDVPSANTIIMDRADKLGLAQLHQLRGRVGRSHHQAYAYLLTPTPKQMSADAKKRLEAIGNLEDLGAGFMLATHDLEIRGTGEILGQEQSGQMESIGFSLYIDMLKQAVKDLKLGKTPNLDQPIQQQTDIELNLPALLPESYMPNVNMRLSFYKQLASLNDIDQITAIKVELVDRFGTLPKEANYLLAVTRLRIIAQKLGIKRIEGHANGGYLEFLPQANIDAQPMIALVTRAPDQYALNGPTKLVYRTKASESQKRLDELDALLLQLAPSKTKALIS